MEGEHWMDLFLAKVPKKKRLGFFPLPDLHAFWLSCLWGRWWSHHGLAYCWMYLGNQPTPDLFFTPLSFGAFLGHQVLSPNWDTFEKLETLFGSRRSEFWFTFSNFPHGFPNIESCAKVLSPMRVFLSIVSGFPVSNPPSMKPWETPFDKLPSPQ